MRRAGARWRRPTAPAGPTSAEAPINAAETIGRREAASTLESGGAPMSGIALSATSAPITRAAQHQPVGIATAVAPWAVRWLTAAISGRSKGTLHNAWVATG